MQVRTCQLVVLSVLLASVAQARTITISADGTGEYPTIQAAADAAASGDEVVLSPGTYTGDGNRDITFGGKNLTVRGTDPADPAVVAATVIDCQGSAASPHRAFYLAPTVASAATISGLTIRNGYSSNGGAIYASKTSITISRCVLAGNGTVNPNSSTWVAGGAVYCIGQPAIMTDSVFHKNYAIGAGGGVYCDRGATIINCVFTDNLAFGSSQGDGVGGGAYVVGWDRIEIINCVFEGNSAGGAGGVYINGGTEVTVTGCRISRNQATTANGGGIYCYGNVATLTDCLITHNSCVSYDTSYSRGFGGGIFFDASSVTLTNCTVAYNSSPTLYGGGSVARGISFKATLTNCIIWGYGGNEVQPAAKVTATYSDVVGGLPGTGNLNIDPLLTWDGHLQATSPCINTGDPAYGGGATELDIDGEARILDGRVDMGADEFVDSDADTLPNYWESHYFGSPTAADPAADNNGTGRTNLQKFVLGLDPIRPPTDYYVDPAGNDAYDGLASTNDGTHGPKATIQAAIDTAALNAADRVILAPGTYTGSANCSLSLKGKMLSVQSTSPDDQAVVAATVVNAQGSDANNRRCFALTMGEGPLSSIAGLTLTGGYVSWNKYYGGAILCQRGSNPTIRDCRITGNQTYPRGFTGGIGAGIGIIDASPVVLRCRIDGNTTGGGVYCSNSRASFLQCLIARNTGTYLSMGGALTILGGQVSIIGCTLSGNSSPGGDSWSGGAISLQSAGKVTMRDCLVTGNSCGAGSSTGISCSNGSTLALLNSTVTANGTIFSDEAVYVDSGSGGQITNCIVWGNMGNLYQIEKASGTGTLTVSYSITRGTGYSGSNNLNIDPKLTADYHLQAGSPAIDAGDLAFVPLPGEADIDNQPRVVKGRVDIGADEYALAGDINGDGSVDVTDLLVLAGSWGSSRDSGAYNPFCDLNSDGSVDVVDLLRLARNWGT